MHSMEAKAVEDVCRDVKRLGSLTRSHKQRISQLLGKRFGNALTALEEGAVKKYVFEPSCRVIWIVVGKGRDYQVIPEVNYCSCDDFYYRVIDGDASLCYHIVAQKLAEALNRYELITDSDAIYNVLMEEWRLIRQIDCK